MGFLLLAPPGKPRWLATTDFRIDSQSTFRNNSCESQDIHFAKAVIFFLRKKEGKNGVSGSKDQKLIPSDQRMEEEVGS